MKLKAIRRPLSAYILWTKQHKLKSALILLFVLWALMLLFYAWPKNITYNFSGESCHNQLTILPNVYSSESREFNYEYKDKIKLFGKDIVAKKVCFNLANLVPDNQTVRVKLHPFDMTLLGQSYKISIPSYPSIKTNQINLDAVPIAAEIVFPLDKQDELFEYKLTINNSTVNCLPGVSIIECEIKNLGLKHNTSYRADINRYFNEQAKPVASLDIKTVEPMSVTDTNVKNGQELASKMGEIVITTDRDIAKVEGLELQSSDNIIKTKHTLTSNKINITLPPDLPRDTSYQLNINQIFGYNNETLIKPYQLTYKLLPGPSIAGSSLQDRATAADANVILYFTQKPAEANYKDLIKLSQSGQAVDFSVYRSGNNLVINPAINLNSCAEIKIIFDGQVANEYGVNNQVNWQANSRVKCAQSFSIGSSKQGRGIIGYSFGTGPKEVLFIAALHGDEYNSKRILEEWMWELEGNPGRIPSGSRVTVIPVLNPDGIALGSRYNASGVDLNRNFPANNWKSDIVIQGGSTLAGGGGSGPLSEPESRAIANYIQNNRPSLVLTYHSQGGIVESNEAANANSLSQTYSNLSGYGFKLASQNTGFFKYDINGSLEEWAKDKLGQPVILIELSTRVYHDFSRNKQAMWAML